MLEQNYITGNSAVNIAQSIEEAMTRGKVAAGAQLPAVRALASELGVSTNTVAAAYRLLRDRGLAIPDGRRGTRVRAVAALVVPPPAPLPEGVRDLSSGNPDLELLPGFAAATRGSGIQQRLYGEEINDARLIELARQQFRDDHVNAQHLAVVSGALDGVERVLREHLRPGDRVAVEDPCFSGILELLSALSLFPVAVTVDDEGMQPEILRTVMTRVQAVIVTPRAQNPTGAAITSRRARRLRAVLDIRPDLLVIEDDHAGAIAGAAYETLVSTSRTRWAVVRSVSKTLGPDLRVALLAGDEQTIARVEGRQRLGIRWVSRILQNMVVALWTDPRVTALLERAERAYTERRVALLQELAERNITGQGVSGLNVWIPVAEETNVMQAMLQRGWAVAAGARYRIATPTAIRVTIADLPPRDASRFAADLAETLRPARRTSVA